MTKEIPDKFEQLPMITDKAPNTLFYKNNVYKNIEAQNRRNLRIS